MQNEETLKGLGFKLMDDSRWHYQGKHQHFIGHVLESSNREQYVELFRMCPKIDERPMSTNFGKNFTHRIKDCCSIGSVFCAIMLYDVPESKLQDVCGGVVLL